MRLADSKHYRYIPNNKNVCIVILIFFQPKMILVILHLNV